MVVQEILPEITNKVQDMLTCVSLIKFYKGVEIFWTMISHPRCLVHQ